MKRLNVGVGLAGAVSLVTFLVHLASLGNDFVEWDDGIYVYENMRIHEMNWEFFRWAFTNFYANFWHPLTMMSHALDYAIWGNNPMGHHLANVALHAVNTFLVVRLTARLLDIASAFSRLRSAHVAAVVTGLLFGLHPLHVESVAWVSERKDLLCGMFYLLSVMAYLSTPSPRPSPPSGGEGVWKPYLAALGFFVLALLSKSMAVSLPVVLLILDWYPIGRIRSARTFFTALVGKIPFAAFAAAFAVLTYRAQVAGGCLDMNEVTPLTTRALVAVHSIAEYLRMMVWPANLSPYYPYPAGVSLSSARYVVPLVLVIGATVAVILAARTQRVWASAWGCYVITLMPVLQLVQVGNHAMADRYTYLASLGPFVLAGLGAGRLFPTEESAKIRRGAFVAGVGLVVAGLALMTVKHIGVWKNGVDLWSFVIERSPVGIALAHHHRAVAWSNRGRLPAAIEDYTRAIQLNPTYEEAYLNRGAAYSAMGQYDKAVEDYNRVIFLNPDGASAYNNRGLAFGDMGQSDRALDDFNRAIALDPSHAAAYSNRGRELSRMNRLDEAIEDYNKAIALNPRNEGAFGNRGQAFMKLGRADDALRDFTRAIEIKPSDKAHFLRGMIYETLGRTGNAVFDYNRAVEMNPHRHEIHLTLGVLYGRTGQYEKSLEHLTRAIELNPTGPVPYINRGFTHALLGHKDQALDDLDRAIELDPNMPGAYFNRAVIYQKTGRIDLARRDYEKACGLGEKNACEALKTTAP